MRTFWMRLLLTAAATSTLGYVAVAQNVAQQQFKREVTLYAPPPAPLELPPGREFSGEGEATRRIRAVLAQPGEFLFAEARLDVIAKRIREQFGLNVLLDVEALLDAGKDAETILTARRHGRTLHGALLGLLESEKLTYLVKDDIVVITAQAEASQPENLTLRLYQVHDLLVLPNDSAAHAPRFDELIDLLQTLIRPSDWQDYGGNIGYLKPIETPGVLALLIRHDERGHREIGRLLDALRRAKSRDVARVQADQPLAVFRIRPPTTTRATTAADTAQAPPCATWSTGQIIPEPAEETRELQAALQQTVDFPALDTTLGKFAEQASAKLGHPVLFDLEALAADGKDADTPVAVDLRQVRLRSALRRVLDAHGLTYLLHDGALVFTTKSAAVLPENFASRVYPVNDLVLIPQATEIRQPEFDPLIDMLTDLCPVDRWTNQAGADVKIRPFIGPGQLSLVVWGPEETHECVAEVLGLLRAARVPEVFEAQQRRPSVKPTSVRILPAPVLMQGGGWF